MLRRNRIYILPTRFGVLFGCMTFAMLLGSLNYGASLGFTLTFLLAGLALVMMHHCHNNLLGLRVRFVGAAPVFAGERAEIKIAVGSAYPDEKSDRTVTFRGRDLLTGLPRSVEVGADHAPPEPAQVTDPVCGMTVDPITAPTPTRAGTTRYFCSAGCRDTFADDIHRTHERPVRT